MFDEKSKQAKLAIIIHLNTVEQCAIKNKKKATK